jgi:hypothetical protein
MRACAARLLVLSNPIVRFPPFAVRGPHVPMVGKGRLTAPTLTDAGAFSPFHAFSRICKEHADVRDGGAAIHGISRAALNKMVGACFHEGVRRPVRKGWALGAEKAKAARHFLQARWRSPDDVEDRMVLSSVFNTMSREEVQESIKLLREFQQCSAGPVNSAIGIPSENRAPQPDRPPINKMPAKMPRIQQESVAIQDDLVQHASSCPPDLVSSTESSLRNSESEDSPRGDDKDKICQQAAALVAAVRAE